MVPGVIDGGGSLGCAQASRDIGNIIPDSQVVHCGNG
jgi:hypothetical protein